MITPKLYLDTRSERKDGTFPIKLKIANKNIILIGLDVFVYKEQWDGLQIIEHSDRKNLNAYLDGKVAKAKNIIFDLASTGKLKGISDKVLRQCIENDSTIEGAEEERAAYLFIDGYNRYVGRLTKASTVSSLRDTFNKVSCFIDIKALTFEMMNVSWIKDFDSFMQAGGLSTNTRGLYFRNIRAVFNDAIDRENIPQNFYPFRRFKIPKAKTQKRSISVDQIIAIRDCRLEPFQEKYRDLFMLIFYLCGINIVDLLNLKGIEQGQINFTRAKTGRLYSIAIPEEAQAIIDKYRGKDYLLCFMDSYKNYRDFRHRLNDNLKKIAVLALGDSAPNLSTYYARHTLATIASDLDIPKETIAAMLGHGGNTVTDIYIDFDQKKVDKAVRLILDYVALY